MPREGDRTPRSLTDWLGLADAPRWGVARPLGVALSVALALLFVLALVATVAVLRDALVDGEGGGPGVGALLVALLGAPFMIWTTVIRHETLRYQKEGHITDRIAKAVEQLGAEKTVKTAGQEESRPNIEVRIGAILALERIAQDSTRLDRGRDHVRVIEILCAYVRENSNARRPRDFPLPEWQPLSDDASDEERAVHEAWRAARFAGDGGPLARQWAEGLPRPRADVQLALRVIGRRSAEQRRVEAAWPDPPGPDTLWPFDPDFPRLPDRPINEPLDDAEIDGVLAGLGRWRGLIGAYRGYRLDLR
ncbi:MAG: hypothetical protein KJZ85_16020 [Rhodobacteraceae bacterium]|jgi:hypothetical protein|nr:hypothetical protein [Paracoccaceae bacterium]